MSGRRWMMAGLLASLCGRALLTRLILASFREDVRRLNEGDYLPLLSRYSDDAVLRFNDGDHRWSGEHRGKDAIERFLKDFVSAGVKGEIRDVWLSGPLWALRIAARFDDCADGPDGKRIYENRTVIVLRTEWGRIVEHDDFYEDTARLDGLEAALRQPGVAPAR